MHNLFDIFNIKQEENVGLSGMTDESFCLWLVKKLKTSNKGILVLTSNITEASNLLNILSNITKDVLFFPMDDFLTSVAI